MYALQSINTRQWFLGFERGLIDTVSTYSYAKKYSSLSDVSAALRRLTRKGGNFEIVNINEL